MYQKPGRLLLSVVRQLLLLFLIVCSTAISVLAQGLHADRQKIVDENGNNVLLRGIGFGGWMLQEGYMLKINKDGQQHNIRAAIESLIGAERTAEFYDQWLANNTTGADIEALKAWGFNSVRLPMHFNLYTLPVDKEPVAGQNTWLEQGFRITDSLLAWCKANKMYLILDLHAAPGGQGNDLNISDRDPSKPSLWESAENQQKTIALWQKLAQRYKDEPWIGGYDIINEPNWGFADPKDKNGLKEQENIPLKKLMVEITSAIRKVDTRHLIIIEGNGWGNNYNGIVPDWDKNIAMSFHKYWNYNDEASIANILKARQKYNVPVWLGETGENSNVWFSDAISLLERHNIGWAWWPLKKIGFNNPMEIKSNPLYDELVNYINGKGNKPNAENVYKGLMKLAADAKLENTIIHRDVIDAMMRQPHNNIAMPFKNNSINGNTIMLAVDYDLGRNSIAYFDKDTADYHVSTNKRSSGNSGRMYRNDGVDIKKASDQYFVTDIEDGEWLQYTINTNSNANYSLMLSTAASSDDGRITVLLDNKIIAENRPVLKTRDMTDFTPFRVAGISLNPGNHIIRIIAVKGGFNLKDLGFVN